jgi:hypothetical protein
VDAQTARPRDYTPISTTRSSTTGSAGFRPTPARTAGTNIGGLDPDQLDDTTIQRFAADLLGKPNATISDLATICAGSPKERSTMSRLTTSSPISRPVSGSMRVSAHGNHHSALHPDDRADGIRWDNKLNWNTGDRPMEGDSVDLASNWVNFGGTHEINDLFWRQWPAGRRKGVLTSRESCTAAPMRRSTSTRPGSSGLKITSDRQLDIDVDGGRFANTGFFDGLLDCM